MIDFSNIQALTFDCYGTLVDWEAGIQAWVAPHLRRALRVSPRPISEAEWFGRWETVQFELLHPHRPYREILARSFEAAMTSFQLESFADLGPGLARSLADWPPFADAVPALRRLARKRRLAIVSNVDDDLLAETLGRLQVPLAALVTAEQAGAYKPDPAPLRLALARLALPPGAILHVSSSWKYDLATARELGFATCLVRRRAEEDRGADLVVPSLAALADALA